MDKINSLENNTEICNELYILQDSIINISDTCLNELYEAYILMEQEIEKIKIKYIIWKII